MNPPFSDAEAAEGSGLIELSRSGPFTLGRLQFHPPTREVWGPAGLTRVVEPRVMQVLVALTEADGRVVSRDRLVARCWDGRVVGDDAITRAVFKARQLAELDPAGAFTIETIPRVGYRLFAAQGATPDPPPATDDSATSEGPSQAPRGPRRVRALAIGALAPLGVLAMVVAVLGSGAWPRAQESNGPRTIAVGDFQAVGASPAERALAASLASRVSDALSRYNVTVKTAPGRGGVPSGAADFILGGHVRAKGDRLVVTAELTEPRDHILVYAFDAAQGPPGDVTQEIANHVALSLDPDKFTNDLDGKLTAIDYTLIARANDAVDRWDPADFLDQAQRLARRHPRDSDLQASTAISALYAAQAAPAADAPRLLDLARRSIARAERLSSASALLCIAKSMMTSGPVDLPSDERWLRAALRLDPRQHVALNGLGETMLAVGRTREGVALIERSIQLDPMSGVVVGQGLQDLVRAGLSEEPLKLERRQAQIWPADFRTRTSDYFLAHFVNADPARMTAFDRANAKLLEAGHVSQVHAATIAQALWSRDPRIIRRMAAGCGEDRGKSFAQVEDAQCLLALVRLANLDEAFAFAALAYPDHRFLYPPGSDDWISKPPSDLETAWLFSPAMAPFRADPRFWDLALRTGLVNYWRTTGSWPDFCDLQLARCRRLAAAAAGDPVRPVPSTARAFTS